jgi:hypothetical protein
VDSNPFTKFKSLLHRPVSIRSHLPIIGFDFIRGSLDTWRLLVRERISTVVAVLRPAVSLGSAARCGRRLMFARSEPARIERFPSSYSFGRWMVFSAVRRQWETASDCPLVHTRQGLVRRRARQATSLPSYAPALGPDRRPPPSA